MKWIQVCTTISLISVLATQGSFAAGALSRDELDAISRSEASWKTRLAQAEDYEGYIQLDVTDHGGVRFSKNPSEFISTAGLSMPRDRRMTSPLFQSWCKNARMIFRTLKKDRNPYQLAVRVFPYARQVPLSFTDGGNGPVELENAVNLTRIVPRLDLSRDANSVVDSEINPEDFLRVVRKQLDEQKSDILLTGVAHLDLTSWDDVACDLFQGYGKLSFAVTTDHEATRVTRRSVIQGPDLQVVYGDVARDFQPQNGLVQNYVLGGALLSLSMMNRLHKTPVEFGVDSFIRVFSKLFTLSTGELSSLQSSNFNELAMSLDTLLRGEEVETTLVRQRVEFVSK